MDNRRYYGLDALRGAMMLLGIVLHGVGFYLVAPPLAMPVPVDHNTSYAADLAFHFIHAFRMPAFFLLAGFFASLLVDKRGVWGMLKDRAARVFAPMLAATVVILPPVIIFVLDFMIAVRFGTMSLIPDLQQAHVVGLEMQAAGFAVDKVSIGHLWFLYYLCIFYVVDVPLCRWLVKHNARIEAFLCAPAALPALGLFTAVTLLPFHGGQVHEGFLFLEPHVPSLVYYGSFFVAGYVLHHHRAMLDALKRQAGQHAALAAILFPLTLFASHADTHGGGAGIRLLAALTNGLCTWALVFAALGAALRFFDRESPWTLYASRSAYWVYLFHMVPICLMGWLLVPFDMPAMIKAGIVMAVTTVLCFASYHYLVQRTWVSRFLHGKRFHQDWPWRAAKAEATVTAS